MCEECFASTIFYHEEKNTARLFRKLMRKTIYHYSYEHNGKTYNENTVDNTIYYLVLDALLSVEFELYCLPSVAAIEILDGLLNTNLEAFTTHREFLKEYKDNAMRYILSRAITLSFINDDERIKSKANELCILLHKIGEHQFENEKVNLKKITPALIVGLTIKKEEKYTNEKYPSKESKDLFESVDKIVNELVMPVEDKNI